MKTRVAIITTYNPGAAGPRYVAGQLMANGHDVKFIHMKELRAVSVPTSETEKLKEVHRMHNDIQYLPFPRPGEVLFVPYPTPITDKELELLVHEVRAYNPHVIGVSMFSVTVNIARRLTKLLHERLPGLPIIWGGIHCMVHPNDCLKGLTPDPVTGETNPLQVPDIICIAEGENPMVQLMDHWDQYVQGEIPEVPGLWFVKGAEVVKFDKLPFEKNLDTYAHPVYAIKEVLIDDNTTDRKFEDPRGFIQHHIYLFTERGCPYSCSFCIHSVINKLDGDYQRIRRRSVDNVLAEVEKRVAENGMKHMIVHDEIFGIQKKWIMEFAEKWERRFKPEGITFTGYVHPITTDFEMVDALVQAGLTRTGLAIQSGSEKTLKEVYDRPLHRDKLIAMSAHLAKHHFEELQVEIITDSVYELEEDRRKTLELVLDLTPPFTTVTFGLVTYSTTELVNKKRLMDEVPWKERMFWNMLYHLCGLTTISHDTIRALSKDTWLRENPEALEKLAIDLKTPHYRVKGALQLKKDGSLEDRAVGVVYAPSSQENGELWEEYRFKKVFKNTVKKLIGR